MRTHWHSALLEMTWTAESPRIARGSVCSTLFGLFKHVPVDLPAPLAFRGADRSLWRAAWRAGQVLPVRVELCADAPLANRWLDALAKHIAVGNSGVALKSAVMERVDLHSLTPLLLENPDELALNFLAPLAFRPAIAGERCLLKPDEFLRLCSARLRRWLGPNSITLPSPSSLQLLCGHWHYEERARVSKSSQLRHGAGGTGFAQMDQHYLNGCMGRLYLRGDLTSFGAALAILARIQLSDTQQGLGTFRVEHPAPPAADARLGDIDAIELIAESVLRVNDTSLRIDPMHGGALHPRELAHSVSQLLQDGSYRADATTVHTIIEDSGKERVIERLGMVDHVVHRVLLDALGDSIDAELSPSAIAYRKRLSRGDAINSIRESIRAGFRFVAQADIADFFPSIEHGRLLAALDDILPRSDVLTRKLVAEAIAIPAGEGSNLRRLGLAQGSPLSPALANLYLRGFDAQFAHGDRKVIRYADDFAILCRSRVDAEQSLSRLREMLAPVGLKLAEHKSSVRAIRDGFEFLGEQIDDRPLEDPLEVIVAQRKPLLVTEPFVMLGVNGDALDVTRHGKMLATIPLRRISELVVLTPAAISTGLLERCNRYKIPMSVAQRSGYQVALFAPDSREFRQFAYRQRAFHAGLRSQDRVAIGCEIVLVKLRNARAWVEGRRQAVDRDLLADIDRSIERVPTANTLERLRGMEGWVARRMFRWIQSQFLAEQAALFVARERQRGAPDRLNSVLNFGYWLLWQRLNGLLRTHGLDPFLGFLHDSEDNYETLVADLQEVFRLHVDRMALRIINRRQLNASHFEAGAEAFRLTRAGAQLVAREFERTMGGRARDGVILRDAMVAQIRALRRWLCDGGPFWLYQWNPLGGRGEAPGAFDGVPGEEPVPAIAGDEAEAIGALFAHAGMLSNPQGDNNRGEAV